jgi:hypothetical protein
MKNLHAIHVKIGHFLFNTSVSFKEFGERIRFSPIISVGKAGRKLSMKFPIK